MRGVVTNIDKIDLKNPSKTVQQFKPYVDPIKDAVDAASKIAKLRPGDISFGVSLKGPLPNSPDQGGVTVTAADHDFLLKVAPNQAGAPLLVGLARSGIFVSGGATL